MENGKVLCTLGSTIPTTCSSTDDDTEAAEKLNPINAHTLHNHFCFISFL